MIYKSTQQQLLYFNVIEIISQPIHYLNHVPTVNCATDLCSITPKRLKFVNGLVLENANQFIIFII